MAGAEGFTFKVRKSGDVIVRHHGRVATTLIGNRAAEFLAQADGTADQELMARLTGNYKRGNERTASQHPRNQKG
jgi:hypothetical protein